MPEKYITYKKFIDRDVATDFILFLKDNDVDFIIEDDAGVFDPTFINSTYNKEICIKLKPSDFAVVDELQLEDSNIELTNVEKDHYLYAFTDAELIDVIENSDEWSKLDFLLAQKILKDRGKEIKQADIDNLWSDKMALLSKPEGSQAFWIILGYAMALLGGLIGFFIGWHLSSHKKTLPNGERIYAYSEKDRKHGNYILLLSIVSFVFWLIWRWNR
jgi:hypothetical protein